MRLFLAQWTVWLRTIRLPQNAEYYADFDCLKHCNKVLKRIPFFKVLSSDFCSKFVCNFFNGFGISINFALVGNG
jgi:hypothetical protein